MAGVTDYVQVRELPVMFASRTLPVMFTTPGSNYTDPEWAKGHPSQNKENPNFEDGIFVIEQ